MAAARDTGGRAADFSGLKAAPCAGRGASRVIFCSVGKNGELIQKLHLSLMRADAAGPTTRLVEIGDDLHQIRRDRGNAEQHKDHSGSSHVNTLLKTKTFVLHAL